MRHGLETMTRLRSVFEERSRGRKIAVEIEVRCPVSIAIDATWPA